MLTIHSIEEAGRASSASWEYPLTIQAQAPGRGGKVYWTGRKWSRSPQDAKHYEQRVPMAYRDAITFEPGAFTFPRWVHEEILADRSLEAAQRVGGWQDA